MQEALFQDLQCLELYREDRFSDSCSFIEVMEYIGPPVLSGKKKTNLT